MTDASREVHRPVVAGRYVLLEQVGRGGMATVHRAHDEVLDRIVAIKVLHPHLAHDPAFLHRFRREAQAAAALNHPNVVTVHDWGETDDGAYLVLQLIDGPSLRELLQGRGQLDPAEALAVLGPVASGLAAAHAAGLVHRDVKPENLLIAHSGTVHITDFGLARAAASATSTFGTGVLVGSPHYLSPEAVLGRPLLASADVYALGVVLFEVLTGQPPFMGDSPYATALAHTTRSVPRPSSLRPDLPAEIDEVVARATRPEPSQRYVDAHAFREAFAAAVPSGPIAVSVPISPQSDDDVPTPAQTEALDDWTAILPLGTDEFAPDEPADNELGPGDGDLEGDAADYLDEPDDDFHNLDHADDEHPQFAGDNDFDEYEDDDFGSFEDDDEPEVVHRSEHADTVFTGPPPSQERSPQNQPVSPRPPPVPAAAYDTAQVDDSRQRRRSWIGFLTVLALIGASALGGYLVWDRLIAPVSSIPPITGSPQEQAQTRLSEAGFDVHVAADRIHDIDTPAGHVLEYEPSEAARIGHTITVVISDGPPPVEVANVIGQLRADAETRLAEDGFEAVVATVHDDVVPEGSVVSLEPDAGTVVEHGTQVRLTVSAGPAPIEVQMPDVTGEHVEEAIGQLEELDLQVSVERRGGFRALLSPGRVFDQSPGADSPVDRGETVELYAYE